jgi:uncharacterized protein (TIGR00661 family)
MKKIKIIYAAGNSLNAKIQMYRFLEAVKDKPYIIKLASYINSAPNIHIDWSLDSLLSVYDPTQKYLDNDNFSNYIEQIKIFNPDLIISDFEYFTSCAAMHLQIPVWQYSSQILNQAILEKHKYSVKNYTHFSYLLSNNSVKNQKINNFIQNSNRRLVCSHLGDISNPMLLSPEYEWIRPYHQISKISAVCQHNVVAAFLSSNKNILNIIKKYKDVVAFSDFIEEKYNNVHLKKIENQHEYFCNLKNCNIFICEGQASFLADAFYNDKKPVVLFNYQDPDCITNSLYAEKFDLCKIINYNETELDIENNIKASYNSNVNYLHQEIDNFFNLQGIS